jgi:hypothetical protein
VRRFLIAILLCCLSVGVASAQIPTSGNVFFGYSYLNSNAANSSGTGLNGWNGSLEGKVLPFIGIVADLDGHYGSQDILVAGPLGVGTTAVSASISQHDFLFGPRASVAIERFRPFAHALFGVSHISESASSFSGSDTSFGDALGGGIDYRLLRIAGARLQVDDLQTRFFGHTQNNLRMSIGLVLRF